MIPRTSFLPVAALLGLLLSTCGSPGPLTSSAAEIVTGRSGSVGGDWPRWRGPRGDGTWIGPKLSEHWPAELKLRWRKPIGGGYAGVIVAGNHVLLADRQ